ncbi:MAG: hypothetical protein ABJA98_03345 [Acidobacteriota bacterium]
MKDRGFGERDDPVASPVLVLNQAFARKYFPGQDVIGKRIRPGEVFRPWSAHVASRRLRGLWRHSCRPLTRASVDPIEALRSE